MTTSAPETSTCLPLSWRLRRALLVALILGLWAPFKIVWEQRIAWEQDILRYHGAPLTRQLSDELGQGLTIGVLSGMGNVVADLLWLNVTIAWENEEWFKMGGYINLCTALQPRCATFWIIGGWQLAWNASVAAMHDPTQPNVLRRIKASRFWIDKGLDVYKRGIENNPEYWRLWDSTGDLYAQRLKDYRTAAIYYQRASELPNAPVFLERAPAEMFDEHHANDPRACYDEWVKLWNHLTSQQREMKVHWKAKIESNIRRLEQKLSIPKEKRIFPN